MKRLLANRLAVFVLGCLALCAGCTKNKVTASAPSTPQAEPTAELTANPSSLHAGEPAELTWTTTNASEVTLEGVGIVEPNGNHKVTPDATTTYKLFAKGPGGQKEAVVEVMVLPAATGLTTPQPQPPPPDPQ